MVKYISIICRPPGTDRQEVIDYWMKVHAPLVIKALPGLRKYVINFSLPAPGTSEPPKYDGVVELYFDDMQAMQKALSGPGWLSPERKASSTKVIDYTRIQAYYVDEHIIPV